MTNAPSASAIRVTLASVPPVACWCRVRVSYGRWHEGSKNNTELMYEILYIWLKVAYGAFSEHRARRRQKARLLPAALAGLMALTRRGALGGGCWSIVCVHYHLQRGRPDRGLFTICKFLRRNRRG